MEMLVKLPDCIPFDYMHQVLLGVVRTLLHNICKSAISKALKLVVNNRLSRFRLPYQEFSRQFRSLDRLKLWKASEFKSFLLYGFVTFTGCIHPNLLAHLFCLSSAIRILLEEASDREKRETAAFLLDTFRKNLTLFYGESSESFNMHSLAHLVQDVSYFSLISYSF